MNFTTIQEITDRNQLALVKLALNHANINFQVLNENSLNAGDAYILGNNGALVQVADAEVGTARKLLLEQDLMQERQPENDQFGALRWFENATSGIPILNQLNVSVRLVLIVFLVVAAGLIGYSVQQFN